MVEKKLRLRLMEVGPDAPSTRHSRLICCSRIFVLQDTPPGTSIPCPECGKKSATMVVMLATSVEGVTLDGDAAEEYLRELDRRDVPSKEAP